jgi:glycine cleavage system H protein
MPYNPAVVYHTSHEWARRETDLIIIGISDYAQDNLGDVVFVELPEPGTKLKKDEPFGVVESVKAASDVYAPVSGVVVEINESLKDDPGLVNKEPFTGGWFIKVKPDDPSEYETLMSPAAYESYVKGI